MYRRSFWLPALAAALFAATAFAAPRDNAATKKIDEAINQHYLATDFDKAEAILAGTIKACEDKCSSSVLAKAWMYIGIVRGSGKADAAGATEAFRQALSLDAAVALDMALATDETRQAFADAKSSAAAGGSGGGGAETPPKPPTSAVGGMDCQPRVAEVQSRRAIPVSCTTDEEAASAELQYKEYGSDKWVTVKMRQRGDLFVGEIPCSATQTLGTLRFYARAKDSSGDTLDNYGTKRAPIEIAIVNETSEEPPSLPDGDAPDRCAEEEVCPPGLPGCGAAKRGDKGWGASCEETPECSAGLVCANGTCETGGSCSADSDCGDGSCVDGECKSKGKSGPQRKLWLGVALGFDLAFLSGDEVCSQDSQENEGFACFRTSGDKEQYGFDPQPGKANKISGGIAPGTIRLMAEGQYFITPNISLGGRLGYAFNGGPKAGDKAFLPLHAEARGSYWLGDASKIGFRPFLHLGGGMAQVDASLRVTILDCSRQSVNGTVQPFDPTSGTYQSCAAGTPTAQPTAAQLDAYKKLGQAFVGLGGGVMYAWAEDMGVVLDVNVMFMLPSSGQVIEPSLGVMKGF